MAKRMAQLGATWRLLRRHLGNTGFRPGALAALAARVAREIRLGSIASIVERHAHHAELYGGYADWLANHRDRGSAGLDDIIGTGDGPVLSLLMPTCNSDPRWLHAAIGSVLGQRYPRWELCIADDASSSAEVRRVLDEYAGREARVRVSFLADRAGIAAATNRALAMATGEFVAFLDHDDVLPGDALAWIAEAIVHQPQLQFLYTDEDRVDAAGRHFWPVFKPAWNPDLLLSNNYITHLMVARRALAVSHGGLRYGVDGAQDWDFALRLTEAIPPSSIGHVPRVLYHWRSVRGSTAAGIHNKPYAEDAQRRCVEDALRRRGIDAEVQRTQFSWRVRYRCPADTTVSIVIPTRDRTDLVKRALDAIDERTGHRLREIVIVDNGSTEPESLAALARWEREGRVHVIRVPGEFNFSNLANAGVAAATGDVVILLNNDVRPCVPGWLDELASHALRAEVGAVGALLLYPDGSLQHAGVFLGINGTTEHAFRGYPRTWAGVNGRVQSIQNVSAVTGACMAFRRDVYAQSGGFDPWFAESHNDVDFCLRLASRGYRIVWTPYAVLEHDESATRGYAMALPHQQRLQLEAERFRSRWGDWVASDPAYNPNLASEGAAFALAPQPRDTAVRIGVLPRAAASPSTSGLNY